MDFCYPSICAHCDRPCEEPGQLCQECSQQLHVLAVAPACECCAKPLVEADAPCPYCERKGTRPFGRILRLGVFRDPLKNLIHQMKYHNRWPLAEWLSDVLWEQPRTKALLAEVDLIVPVPLHRWRQIARGYNQSQVIAARMSKRSNLPLASPVVRLRNTKAQTQLHARQKRIENLRHAFGLLHPEAVRGKRILVVDDVATTGATLQSIGGTLMEGEPATLDALVLAVADPKGRDFERI